MASVMAFLMVSLMAPSTAFSTASLMVSLMASSTVFWTASLMVSLMGQMSSWPMSAGP